MIGRRRAPGPLVIGRALGGGAYLVGGAATLAAWRLLPRRSLAVLGRDGVYSVIWPLVPALLAVAVPAAVRFDARLLERVSGRPRWTLRARGLGLLAVVGAVVVAGSPYDAATCARNLLILVGGALVAASLLPASVAWVPIALYPPCAWLLGTRTNEIHAAWAVPLRPAGDPLAWRVAVVVAMVGVVVHLVLGTRGGAGDDDLSR